MSQRKMTFSQKFQKAKSSGSFSAALMLAPAVFFLCLCSIYPFIWIFRYVASVSYTHLTLPTKLEV